MISLGFYTHFNLNRWLKPGGLMLPDKAKIFIVPVCDDEIMVEKVNFWNDMEEVYAVDMNCLIPFARESLSKEVSINLSVVIIINCSFFTYHVQCRHIMF